MLSVADLTDIVRVSIELSAERDGNRLLQKLLATAMGITGCDAGTLYLYQDDGLVFKIMRTDSQGINQGGQGEPIDLPSVALCEENVCAYAALHRELVNIDDVYRSDRFDFSGPKRYDSITGYCTRSMLVVPMEESEGELIGVLQLINKLNDVGEPVPFTKDDESILQSLGSMTAVSLANMIYVDEIKAQMHSFVRAFATAVDERTPYNGTHTRKVTLYAYLLARQINQQHERGITSEYFDEARLEQLVLSAALHDIGKMVVPLSVMNKATRLDWRIDTVRQRFELLRALLQIDHLKGRLTDDAYEQELAYLDESLSLIEQKNEAGFLPDDARDALAEVATHVYEYEDGRTLSYLTAEERDCLLVRKGTLTANERLVMEGHAAMTRKILSKVCFGRRYGKVLAFASQHHEYLNGTGYPDHLVADDLELETRILTVVDVFDALTCTDRPYKRPIPRPRAFAILHAMAADGQIEDRLVSTLEEALTSVPEDEVERLSACDDWGVALLR